VVGYIIITLLLIVCKVCKWENFEIQSIIGEDMYTSTYGPRCIYDLFTCSSHMILVRTKNLYFFAFHDKADFQTP